MGTKTQVHVLPDVPRDALGPVAGVRHLRRREGTQHRRERTQVPATARGGGEFVSAALGDEGPHLRVGEKERRICSEWGYEIFQAIERNCKTKYGYGEYPDVLSVNALPDDRMESFFPAETIKYLYLLFSPSLLDLDKIVFNTEGHPLRVL